uniref:TRIC cation channel family protein n=1 Tax=Orrella sp. TaxID=1921583 RepID=UPI004048D2EA
MQRLSYWCFSLFAMVVFVASAGITHAQASAQQGGTQPLDAVVQVPTASTQTQALSPAQSRTELRAGWYRWDPYQFQMTKNEITRLTGLDVELLRAIFAKMGYSLVFDEVNWKQHQDDVSNGVRDIAAGAFFSEERSQYAYYSDAYRTEKDVIYVRTADAPLYDFKTKTQWINLLQTQNIRLGVIDGFFYGTDMMSFIEDPANAARIVRVSTDDENFANLLDNKVDAIAIDELVGETLVWRNDWAKAARQIGTPIFSGGIHVIFSKATTTPELVASFNQSLKQLRESGEYKYIVKEYLLPVLLGVTAGQWWFFAIDVIGTIAFALSGVLLARQGKYSFFGALVLAATPSVGGGIIRDVLLQRETLSVLKSPLYLMLIFGTVVIFYIIFRFQRFWQSTRVANSDTDTGDLFLIGHLSKNAAVAFFDAVGLAAFTVIGVIVAVDANIQPLWLWGPILAALTGAGGGILRDVIRADVDNPGLKGSFYAEVAVIWGLVLSLGLTWYADLQGYHPEHITALVVFVLFGALTTRMVVFHYKIRSPMF